MSIKPIESLPPERESVTRRKMLRDDIMSAISQRITAFEFEGDYNYKYLAQYAREQAEYIFKKEVYWQAMKKVREKLKKEWKGAYVFAPSEFSVTEGSLMLFGVKCTLWCTMTPALYLPLLKQRSHKPRCDDT